MVAEEKCPLCGRELGTINVDEHHLVPKAFKGKTKEKIHRICHMKLHATLSEREMYNYYNTWDRLRVNPLIESFVKWVQKKPIDYIDTHIDSNDRKKKRRR